MSRSQAVPGTARLIEPTGLETWDIMGVQLQFLTPVDATGLAPAVMRGTMPPGIVVPLHSHPDPETLIHIEGVFEGLDVSDDGAQWIRVEPGGIFHIPSGVKHALRNLSTEPAVSLLVSTAQMARFFREIGEPGGGAGPLSEERLRHFLDVTQRYGYWNAGPEENARSGLALPEAGGPH